MTYNVSYDMCAVMVTFVVYIALRNSYYVNEIKSNAFRKYVICVLSASLLDLITAYTIMYGQYFNDFFNTILNTLYQCSTAFTLYFGVNYILLYINNRPKWSAIVTRILMYLYIALYTVNVFTGFIFSFEKHTYVHGPFFIAAYVLSFMMVIVGLICIFTHFNSYDLRKTRVLSILFLLIPVAFMCIQFAASNYLIIYFGETISVLIMLFSIETPDYQKLIVAMKNLREATLEAQIANTSKGRFLANMSHEIRTPLNGILGMNSMILKSTQEENVREYAQNVDSAGHTLLSLINDILDFSKIESGNMDIICTEYNVNTMITETTDLVIHRAEEKDLTLVIENNEAIPSKLLGDVNRIKQVMVNLLTNAIKYTKQGSVTLKLDFSRKNDEYIDLIISVADTGQGISEENMENLFTAFKRINEKENRNIEGTGLGLSITTQLLGLMNGSIDVSSKVGEGSVFTVTVPQKIIEETPMGSYSRKKPGKDIQNELNAKFVVSNLRALVVDDVEMNIFIMEAILKEMGFIVDKAQDGLQCLEHIKEHSYDIVFLDHMMPNMDGIETLEKMFEIDSFSKEPAPVIALTANAVVGARDEYLAFGFDDYLSKPIEFKDLYNLIRKFMPEDKITYL